MKCKYVNTTSKIFFLKIWIFPPILFHKKGKYREKYSTAVYDVNMNNNNTWVQRDWLINFELVFLTSRQGSWKMSYCKSESAKEPSHFPERGGRQETVDRRFVRKPTRRMPRKVWSPSRVRSIGTVPVWEEGSWSLRCWVQRRLFLLSLLGNWAQRCRLHREIPIDARLHETLSRRLRQRQKRRRFRASYGRWVFLWISMWKQLYWLATFAESAAITAQQQTEGDKQEITEVKS